MNSALASVAAIAGAITRVLSRSVRRLAKNPYAVAAASLSSIAGLVIAVYQVMNPTSAEYLDSVKWTDSSVADILRDGTLVEAIHEDKRGMGHVAFIGFGQTNDPLARFWNEFARALNQSDVDLFDRSHVTFRRLTDDVISLRNSVAEKEALLFYLQQRLARLRSVHLHSDDDPVLFSYLQSLGDVGFAAGEIRSPWLSSNTAKEFQWIAESWSTGGATKGRIQYALRCARWGYVQAGSKFPESAAMTAWRSAFLSLEDLVIAHPKELWPEGRTIVDIRFAIAHDLLQSGAKQPVLVYELQSMCRLANRSEESGVLFPASWARLHFFWFLKASEVPASWKPNIGENLMDCLLPMAVRDVDVHGSAEETADVMADACTAFGIDACGARIEDFERHLKLGERRRFLRFQRRFFRLQGGNLLPTPVTESTEPS